MLERKSVSPSSSFVLPVAQMRRVFQPDDVERRLAKLPEREHDHLRATYERMLERGPQRFQVKPAGVPDMQSLYDTLPNFTDVLVTIPWAVPFAWVPQPGRHLLVEITVYGNSWGSGIYGYPIDNLSGTYSLYGTPANATVANSGLRGFGLVMGFDAQTNTAVPHLYSDDTPQIGNTFRVRVNQCRPSTVALLLFGMSATSWNGLSLPFDLGAFGAPGCALLVENLIASALVTNGSGATNLQYSLPYDIYVLGQSFYNQAFVFDPTANAFGFVASNAGHGVFGNQ